MKRLVVCCDGTWQDVGKTYPTNVANMAAAVSPVARDGTPQLVHYSAGIGTNGLANKIFGGGFGKGIDFHIKDAYRFLCLNYSPGDEIFLFGFSRGAYTVRCVAGMIYNSGLLLPRHIDKISGQHGSIGAYQLYRKRGENYTPKSPFAAEFRKSYCVQDNGCNNEEKYKGRVPITLLACWDTVGALGIPPIGFLNIKKLFPLGLLKKFRGKRFVDLRLSRIILTALHAVSIDERRRAFNVTAMRQDKDTMHNNGKEADTISKKGQRLYQVWFPGNHGSVGGGSESLKGLSNATFWWMVKEMEKLNLGLELDVTHRAPEISSIEKTDPLISFAGFDLIAFFGGRIWRTIDVEPDRFDSQLDVSVKVRWRDLIGYHRSDNLKKKFGVRLDEWAKTNPCSGAKP
jgi:uncharacterized protein (DUF2235 family)